MGEAQDGRRDLILVLAFSAAVLAGPLWLTPIGAGYPDLLQRFAIYGIFALGFNILFGLTGYLSFGHAAFLGVGSYAAVWSFKLVTMNVLPAIVFGTLMGGLFAAAIGFISLRRTGIYFSILTLAFAQMSYNLAYSVLTPITNGETALQPAIGDPRVLDRLFFEAGAGLPTPNLFGLNINGYPGFYFCAVMLILAFCMALRFSRSAVGLKLRAIKSNQVRVGYVGLDVRPYLNSAFIISGMYAGLAGALLAATDPLAGAERMQWTASGEVVLMTILGGSGSLLGPILGAGIIKYAENIFSAYNDATLNQMLGFLPEGPRSLLADFLGLFVGDGWQLTLGVIFMLIVIFLPGGLVEGIRRLAARLRAGYGRREPASERGR